MSGQGGNAFNFDEEFSKMGAGNLVRKPLASLKQQGPTQHSKPAAMPSGMPGKEEQDPGVAGGSEATCAHYYWTPPL